MCYSLLGVSWDSILVAVIGGVIVGVIMLIINYAIASPKRRKEKEEKEEQEREAELESLNESIKELTMSINEKFEEQKADMDLLKTGVLQSLRIGLDELYDKYEKKKFATTEERESVQRVFDAYKALGGNGLMKKRHEDFLRLPSTPPEKKIRQAINKKEE